MQFTICNPAATLDWMTLCWNKFSYIVDSELVEMASVDPDFDFIDVGVAIDKSGVV